MYVAPQLKHFIIALVKPEGFKKFAELHGQLEKYSVDQIFHAQNFPHKLFLLRSGYVKRYQSTDPENRVLELIYGPGHIISLSQLYKALFNVNQNEENLIYIYQAMCDVEMLALDANMVLKEIEKDAGFYKDFFYESGLRLRSNIFRLASNSIKDDYKKVAHQIASFAYEFAGYSEGDTRNTIELPLPQTAVDMAEQLNISKEVAEAVMNSLCQSRIISIKDDRITIVNFDLLKDVYL